MSVCVSYPFFQVNGCLSVVSITDLRSVKESKIWIHIQAIIYFISLFLTMVEIIPGDSDIKVVVFVRHEPKKELLAFTTAINICLLVN